MRAPTDTSIVSIPKSWTGPKREPCCHPFYLRVHMNPNELTPQRAVLPTHGKYAWNSAGGSYAQNGTSARKTRPWRAGSNVRSNRLACAKHILVTVFAALFIVTSARGDSGQGAPDVTAMSVEDLMNVQVTSVSKRTQRVADAAAAVFVITQDDIKRSGARNIPETLRMAPGIEVARIDENKWAISARGFNGRFANKVPVLSDGRSVYTPV